MAPKAVMMYSLCVINLLLAAISCLHHLIFDATINVLFAIGMFALARYTND
jgi:hypothetical protein